MPLAIEKYCSNSCQAYYSSVKLIVVEFYIHCSVHTAKDYTVCQRLPVQKKSELLMMSSLKLETCRVKDD